MYKPLRKTDIVVEHSFLIAMQEVTAELLLKEESKILQTAWSGAAYPTMLRKVVLKSYREQVEGIVTAELTTVCKKILLITLVELLKAEFPSEFKRIGWWGRQVAVERRLQ